jgi:hypothetical protein
VLSRTRVTNCFLPRNRPFSNLFRLELDEEQYRLNGKALTNFLTRPEVEGVYEMNVSLTSRAVSELALFVKRDGATGGVSFKWFKGLIISSDTRCWHFFHKSVVTL